MPDDQKPQAPKSPMPYLNPRFKIKLYNWDTFVGPAAGQPSVDFTATDYDGNEVKLSDFLGKWVVLETGSSTCSQYTKNIENMRALIAEFADVEFIVVYVREAHPGERLGQHKTFDDKKFAACLLTSKYQEHRRVLIDTLDGDMHRAYGAMPNVVYVIRPDGVVHYRCDWTHIAGLKAALTDRENLHTLEHAKIAEISSERGIGIAIRTMWTGGFLALWDFVIAGPSLLKKHKLIDAYYDEHGRFKNRPGA